MTADEFRAARQRLGLSAAKMAEAIGVAHGRHIRKIEAGERPVSEPVAKLIGYLLRDHAERAEAE